MFYINEPLEEVVLALESSGQEQVCLVSPIEECPTSGLTLALVYTVQAIRDDQFFPDVNSLNPLPVWVSSAVH